MEIGRPQPRFLRVHVTEQPPLQQRIVGEIDPRRNVLGHEGDLFGFREEIVGHAVEHQPAHRDRRQDLLRYQLRRIEHVEFEGIGEILIE